MLPWEVAAASRQGMSQYYSNIQPYLFCTKAQVKIVSSKKNGVLIHHTAQTQSRVLHCWIHFQPLELQQKKGKNHVKICQTHHIICCRIHIVLYIHARTHAHTHTYTCSHTHTHLLTSHGLLHAFTGSRLQHPNLLRPGRCKPDSRRWFRGRRKLQRPRYLDR